MGPAKNFQAIGGHIRKETRHKASYFAQTSTPIRACVGLDYSASTAAAPEWTPEQSRLLKMQVRRRLQRPPLQLRAEATERFDDTAYGRGHRPRPTQPTLSTLGPRLRLSSEPS